MRLLEFNCDPENFYLKNISLCFQWFDTDPFSVWKINFLEQIKLQSCKQLCCRIACILSTPILKPEACTIKIRILICLVYSTEIYMESSIKLNGDQFNYGKKTETDYKGGWLHNSHWNLVGALFETPIFWPDTSYRAKESKDKDHHNIKWTSILVFQLVNV